MSKHAEIIDLLEKASGPDADLDWLVAASLWKKGKDTPYTGSVDAALALASSAFPDEWIDIGGMTGRDEWECNIHTDFIEVQAHASTAPLAILLAMFKALEKKAAEHVS